MNERIKEILDYLKNDDYSPVFADESCDDTPYKLFDEDEVKLLLDYITNLQQENEKTNNFLDFYKDLADKQNKSLRDYKLRIEKAIHRIQLIQMDGEVSIKDLGLLVRDLQGEDNERTN